MKHPLEKRLGGLRRRVRRLVTVHGLGRVLAAVCAGLLVAGAADWLLHLGREVRLILGLAILGVAGWTTYRCLLRPLVARLGDLEVALRVEERYPGLNDRLASTVQFLREPAESARVGSAALRRAVVEQTVRDVEALDFHDVAEVRIARQAAVAAAVVGMVAALAVLADPTGARVAVARLLNPYGGVEWPRQTTLVIAEAPTRLARGDAFSVEVLAEGRVPRMAEMLYRFPNGERDQGALKRVGKSGFRGGLEIVSRSFEFAVRGGDHQTLWQKLDVVPPPSLESLRVRLTYPDYTGLGAEDQPEGRGHARAVIGTRLDLTAKASKDLAIAGLRLGDQTVPAALGEDARTLAAHFTVEATGTYWVSLKDREGFANREATRYEVQAIKDLAPDIHIESPASDVEVTPSAVLPVRAVAKDDFGIRDIELRYTPSGDAEAKEQVVPLYQGTERPKRQVAELAWNLAELKLTHGAVVSYFTQARDYDNLHGPNVGKSRVLRLRVVTEQELLKRLYDRQTVITQEIERIYKLQEQTLGQVKSLGEQVEHTGRLGKRDLDNLQTAEFNQRQISQRLTSSAEGVRGQVRGLVDDLRNNQVKDSETLERMQSIETMIAGLEAKHLPHIEEELTRARKAAQSPTAERSSDAGRPEGQQTAKAAAEPTGGSGAASKAGENAKPPESKAVAKASPSPANSTKGTLEPSPKNAPAPIGQERDALRTAQGHQEQVASALRNMLEQLGKWETFRGVLREAQELIKEQEAVAKQTADASKDTVGKPPEELSQQEQADLAKAATRQADLAERLTRLESRIDKTAGTVQETDPTAADTLREAAEQSRQAGTAQQMRQAAGDVRQNRTQSASTAQRGAAEKLREMVDIMENRRERELAKLVEKLRAAEKELQGLRDRQTATLKKTQGEAAKKAADERKRELARLSKEQAELRSQTERLARQLARLQAEQAGQTAGRASGQMGQAQQQMDQDQGNQAGEEQERALEQLEQAQRELAQARREAEQQLAIEQLAKIGDQLGAMHGRQAKVIEDTVEYEKLRAAQQKWTRGQLQDLRRLAEAQRVLKDETGQLVEKLSAAEVFALALRRASSSMDQAARRLDERETDAETQRHEKSAAERIAQLLDALKPERNQRQNQQQGGGGGGGGGGTPDGIPSLAQLKLLKALQVEINQRTGELEAVRHKQGRLDANQEAERSALGKDQGALADLVRNLTRASEGESP